MQLAMIGLGRTPAGDPVDQTIETLTPLLAPGDVDDSDEGCWTVQGAIDLDVQS